MARILEKIFGFSYLSLKLSSALPQKGIMLWCSYFRSFIKSTNFSRTGNFVEKLNFISTPWKIDIPPQPHHQPHPSKPSTLPTPTPTPTHPLHLTLPLPTQPPHPTTTHPSSNHPLWGKSGALIFPELEISSKNYISSVVLGKLKYHPNLTTNPTHLIHPPHYHPLHLTLPPPPTPPHLTPPPTTTTPPPPLTHGEKLGP